jgi:hypothetical protein
MAAMFQGNSPMGLTAAILVMTWLVLSSINIITNMSPNRYCWNNYRT